MVIEDIKPEHLQALAEAYQRDSVKIRREQEITSYKEQLTRFFKETDVAVDYFETRMKLHFEQGDFVTINMIKDCWSKFFPLYQDINPTTSPYNDARREIRTTLGTFYGKIANQFGFNNALAGIGRTLTQGLHFGDPTETIRPDYEILDGFYQTFKKDVAEIKQKYQV